MNTNMPQCRVPMARSLKDVRLGLTGPSGLDTVLYSAPEYWSCLGGCQMGINVKFSEDIVPLGDMKVNPGKIVRRIDETGRPALLTSHGRGVAVVQALSAYEAAQEEREFMRAVVAGLADIDAARVVPMTEVKRRLGLD